MNTNFKEKARPLKLTSGAFTDRGQHRQLNEDAIYHQTRQTGGGENIGLYLVCDGLGGHHAGQAASRLAVKRVTAELAELLSVFEMAAGAHTVRLSPSERRQYVHTAIIRADREIKCYAQSHPSEEAEPGTTIVLAFICGEEVLIANVGDSRAYVWRSGQVIQLTQDHSWAAELARMGEIDESRVADHHWSHVLSQALGTTQQLKIDFFEWQLEPKDKLLLCSDGVWQAFPDNENLAWWLSLNEAPADLCWRLVLEANRRDGSDNLSAVIISAEEAADLSPQMSETRPASFVVK